jgi:proton-translocating NADH-quinone oxidoreductase chain L
MNETLAASLPTLLGIAWLLPLASFTLIVLFGPRMGKHGVGAAYLATFAIVVGFLCSLVSLGMWLSTHPLSPAHAAEEEHAIDVARAHEPGAAHHAGGELKAPDYYAGDIYTLGQFGSLKVTIGYYIDALTVGMFAMVTLIASCIHFYAIGYMHDELHDVTDHEVVVSNGHHLHRRGRFHRFFQYMSLFCFSMLGLVYAGNIAMVFVFWELVGICSYFLIGFYIERKSASNAANKAFIVNRVGDFGMIIGLMALFGSLGTFAFDEIFTQVRGVENHYELTVPDGMVRAAAHDEIADVVLDHRNNPDPSAANSEIRARMPGFRSEHYGYWLLVIAGVGIFCGCVGKSAQFPLHVWLPDAMEGPTPVSALVHSATMVAAGVYLAGRFYPVFTPEARLIIAYCGGITLFLAATIAITATDIKRVLAYSTVSQLGYMMLSLGVGGWVAGLFHLITHAFFKSLLFLCSGSVIHACHTNEMPKMGGLLKKMPWTGYTMLVGCLAIIGAGLPPIFGFWPFGFGLSGFYSKDSIIAQAYSFWKENPSHGMILFGAAAGGASMTAFYMFRLWFMTFIGPPRDHHIYEHAHESPKIMYVPLVILAVFAVAVGWTWTGVWSVTDLLEQARWPGEAGEAVLLPNLVYPNEHESHEHSVHLVAGLTAFSTALGGVLLAAVFYGVRWLNPAEVRQQFAPIYTFLLNKWYFDELYDVLFVRPVHFVAAIVAWFDKQVIDGLIDNLARWTRGVADIDDLIDRYFVDGLVNLTAAWIWSLGNSLRGLQTGKLRQYVMLIVIGTIALTIIINFASAR